MDALIAAVTRRRLLSSAVGLTVSLAAPRARAGAPPGRSLIVLWLAGGPSQLETFDPHPRLLAGDAPPPVATQIPGVAIAGHYPRLAEQMHKLSLIRSLVSKEGDHARATHYLKTGHRPDPTARHPTVTAVVAHQRPTAGLEIPAHVALGSRHATAWGGLLGPSYDAFMVAEPGASVGDLASPVTDPRRLRRRRAGLAVIAEAFARRRGVEQTRHLETVERAMAVMRSDQVDAFRLDEEPKAVVEAYGDHRFGRGCLVARRLVERGVPAVEVTLTGFDAHAGCPDAHREAAAALDPALARLIADLDERDLLRTTAVMCLGEFGRTPRLNALEGRDHWPRGFCGLVGGAGLRPGALIGATDPEGRRRAPVDPVRVEDLTATVLRAVGVDPTTEVYTPAGRPIMLSAGRPITRLTRWRG